ncbi:MAG TPA: hypothetical protein PKX87_08045, partial [Alphaproteobacteria bacterium]|nr:hypothetical protein [Alphaproteobacteria bacterium]
DIISGIQGTAVSFSNGALPSASTGGGFWAGYTTDGTATGLIGPAMRVGHYFVFNGTPVNVGTGTGGLQPLQAERIDRTMDDGLPNSGTVRAGGDAAAGGCAPTAGVAELYNNLSGANTCALFIRFQG